MERRHSTHTASAGQRGFMLAEVLVAMIILADIPASLGQRGRARACRVVAGSGVAVQFRGWPKDEEAVFMDARYVVDEDGERVEVILKVEDFERMLEELEELDDIRAYDRAKAEIERGGDEAIPLEQAMREIKEGKVTGD